MTPLIKVPWGFPWFVNHMVQDTYASTSRLTNVNTHLPIGKRGDAIQAAVNRNSPIGDGGDAVQVAGRLVQAFHREVPNGATNLWVAPEG